MGKKNGTKTKLLQSPVSIWMNTEVHTYERKTPQDGGSKGKLTENRKSQKVLGAHTRLGVVHRTMNRKPRHLAGLDRVLGSALHYTISV